MLSLPIDKRFSKTCFEWDSSPNRLDAQSEQPFLSERDEDLVLKLNDMVSKAEGQPEAEVLRVNLQGIRTFSHVGIVQLGKKRIEILPKIYKTGAQDEETVGCARKNLLQMLSKAGLMPIHKSDISAYGAEDDFFEFLIRLFLDDLETILNGQLHREYMAREEELSKLRGKLDLRKQLVKLPSRLHVFSCIHDEFSEDNLLNRVIKAALFRLSALCSHPENIKRVKIFYAMLDEVKDEHIRAQHFMKLRLNRLNIHYETVIAFCRLVLLESTPTIAERPENFYGIVFNMNDVFEKYVARALRAELRNFDVRTQVKRNLCYKTRPNGPEEPNCKQVIPDIVVFGADGKKPLAIVDTKYKLSLDRYHSVAASDIYQMIAYSKALDCDEVFLVFPKIPLNEKEPVQKEFWVRGNLGEPQGSSYIHITACTAELIDNKDGKLSKTCTRKLGDAIRELFKSGSSQHRRGGPCA